jgi:pyrimidine-nucleoside phosphorylase
VRVGNQLGKKFAALITAMDQPLGRMAGNALEVRQAIEVLRGEGPSDLREVVLALGAELLVLVGEASSPKDGQAALSRLLIREKAFAKFRELVAAQGGDIRAVEEPDRLPKAAQVVEVRPGNPGMYRRSGPGPSA